MNTLGLYLHLPFCRSKCGYCAFNSRPLRDANEFEAYLHALEKELAAQVDHLARATVATIYFGGGTPSLAAPSQLGTLIAQVRRLAGALAPDAEITLEANPDTLTEQSLAELRAAGVNRLSLGAQSFGAAALAFLERRHRPAQAERAFRAARRVGFDNVSLDLIAGLPAPHDEAYRADLAAALALAPEHLSVYLLTAEPPSRLHEAVCAGRVALLDAERQVDIFLDIDAALVRAGFEHYEVSNFARPGRRARHNAAYWSGAPYLGLGAGAHSFGEREGQPSRWANASDADEYVRRLERGASPVDFTETVTPEMARREKLMLKLRTSEGADLREFGEAAPILAAALSRFVEQGWYTRDGTRFRPTPAGMLVADGVATALWKAMEP